MRLMSQVNTACRHLNFQLFDAFQATNERFTNDLPVFTNSTVEKYNRLSREHGADADRNFLKARENAVRSVYPLFSQNRVNNRNRFVLYLFEVIWTFKALGVDFVDIFGA